MEKEIEFVPIMLEFDFPKRSIGQRELHFEFVSLFVCILKNVLRLVDTRIFGLVWLSEHGDVHLDLGNFPR